MAETATRKLTINEEKKRYILGAWLNGEHLEDINKFEPHHFGEHGEIVRAMKQGVKKIDGEIVDIFDIAKRSGVLAKTLLDIKGYQYYDALYAQAVMEMQPILAREWIVNHPDASPEEIEEAMKRFTEDISSLPMPSKDPMGNFIKELDRRASEKMVTTGIHQLDKMLCGVRKKELTAVAARPSVGKSALLEQIAMEVSKQGKKVLFFPLEMSETSIVQRMVMQHTLIPQYELRNGLRKETWERSAPGFDMVDSFLGTGNFLIFERCNDISVIRRLIEYHKPYMVAIDQLEQLKDGKKSWVDKRARFSYMTHEMQAISLDLDVAVWFACQANRGAEDVAPTMANLKESGTIEEDSTNVLLLHRISDKGEDQDMQIELAKQKDGECGIIKLNYKAPNFKFYEYIPKNS